MKFRIDLVDPEAANRRTDGALRAPLIDWNESSHSRRS